MGAVGLDPVSVGQTSSWNLYRSFRQLAQEVRVIAMKKWFIAIFVCLIANLASGENEGQRFCCNDGENWIAGSRVGNIYA